MVKLTNFLALMIFLFPLAACALVNGDAVQPKANEIRWQSGVSVETFWKRYTDANGGLAWGESSVYPEYEKVKEGDTLLIRIEQGPCLMEFFHSRWRRANDVRRWHDSINDYGGCPYVFD